MKNKLILLSFGSLITLSISSPPEFIDLLGFNFSDISFFLSFAFLLTYLFNQEEFFQNIKDNKDSYWFYSLSVFVLTFLFYGFNTISIRFIFYIAFGFLSYLFMKKFSLLELQFFFLPFLMITILNVFTVIFELSFLNNTIGWISFYYEDPNFFNRGRLAGYQGGGPNVAGSLFTFLTLINLYFYNKFKNMVYLFATLINLFLLFVTFSRGSYAALLLSCFAFLLLKKINLKKLLSIAALSVVFLLIFTTIGSSQILLKESDREYLTQIAIENIKFFKGYGGGNYVEEIYGNYFLSINPEILEENLNVRLDKVELGITPEEFRNSGINFYIGTSGGGFEILQQSNIIFQCTDDRITCQHVRVDHETIVKFISSVTLRDFKESNVLINNSDCKENLNEIYTRGEFFCIIDFLFEENILDEKATSNNDFFVECEISGKYECANRKLAVGELSVLVEKLTLNSDKIPIDNYKIFCKECEFRSVSGFIKIVFDKKQGVIPRSIFEFYTSTNGLDWDQIGFSRTKGRVIDFTENTSFIEVGGHSDGQSFGNTFLDATLKSIEINTNNQNKKIIFDKSQQNKNFYVFKPNSSKEYNANITYQDNGIKLFRPNKYWIALDNGYNFAEDFEIIIDVSFPEIPWETQTLISNTSIFENQIQSWRVDIDDGRIFFYWTNQDGVFQADNVIGDKSLRSGILIQQNGKLSNQQAPIVDPSYLSQLTTAHNGYLTFAVEYGLFISMLFFLVIFSFIFKLINELNKENIFLFMCLTSFLFQNLTNDMIYSSDAFILFNIVYALIIYSINPLESKKS